MARTADTQVVNGVEMTVKEVAEKLNVIPQVIYSKMKTYDLTLQDFIDGIGMDIGWYAAYDKKDNHLGTYRAPIDYVKAAEVGKKKYPKTKGVRRVTNKTQSEKNRISAKKKKAKGYRTMPEIVHDKDRKDVAEYCKNLRTIRGYYDE